jgi:hypothetical protein
MKVDDGVTTELENKFFLYYCTEVNSCYIWLEVQKTSEQRVRCWRSAGK